MISYLDRTGFPLGLRNNNPGNLVDTGENWKGRLPSDGGRFLRFQSIEYGIRAMYIDILGDIENDGLDTLRELFRDQYAPAGDGSNDPLKYAKTVGAVMGIGIDAPIPLTESALVKLGRGIVRVENYQSYADTYISDQMLKDGLTMAMERFDDIIVAGGISIATILGVYLLYRAVKSAA